MKPPSVFSILPSMKVSILTSEMRGPDKSFEREEVAFQGNIHMIFN